MYITEEALSLGFSKKILVELSNDEPRATEPNNEVVAMAIRFADERIDAALRSRYRLPLTEVPTSLFLYAECLARYWLYGRRPETKMPDLVKENFKWAVGELEKIQNGKLHLGLATLIDPAETAESVVETGNDLLPDSSEYEVRANTKLNTFGY
ncbi:phage protein Gp36 family protein [[Pasteurella] aerogenes]